MGRVNSRRRLRIAQAFGCTTCDGTYLAYGADTNLPRLLAWMNKLHAKEGAWVRANAWTKGLRKIEDAYPYGFHRWCSCEAGTCHPCASGHHDQCAGQRAPRRQGRRHHHGPRRLPPRQPQATASQSFPDS
jgi:hypothetical protein